ncbi:Hypothetical protein FKW44_019855 [Caligus rogercresseyi]|uniref:Uncharacterized protein n=1 Tax=Caligus rogercresseyi TaxID=217165 RepID=A0A7T8JYQ2_CALRO|nr:Hypothetical protein FKW44_019855 [Caligus rogercresseyi]
MTAVQAWHRVLNGHNNPKAHHLPGAPTDFAKTTPSVTKAYFHPPFSKSAVAFISSAHPL